MKMSSNSSRRQMISFALVLSAVVGVVAKAESRGWGAEAISKGCPELEELNYTMEKLGRSAADSIPLGNGDLGINVWTEPNGDLCFYLSKTDAWAEENHGPNALLKLGRFRMTMTPNPFANSQPVRQTLHLHEGYVVLTGEKPGHPAKIKVWVDANRPVVRVECESGFPVEVRATYEPLRKEKVERVSPDVTVPGQKDRVVWYHHNADVAHPALKDYVFGGSLQGEGFIADGERSLLSAKGTGKWVISVHALTVHPTQPEAWLAGLDQTIKATDAVNLKEAQAAHEKWWSEFWDRSWIYVKGDAAAATVTRGATLQRYITACAGRGPVPIKFNGSIFNVDNPAFQDIDPKKPPYPVTADWRRWGGQYWFQNTRAMYWPRLMAGDFEMMMPLFRMYEKIMADNQARVKEYYGHDGAYFQETAPFYGGLKRLQKDKGEFTDHYFTPILELSAMMLDYYEYTGNEKFLKETAIPMVKQGLLFFEQHFGRDAEGKLLMEPSNALETYWMVKNPASDIGGLSYVVDRLLALPATTTSEADRAAWTKFKGILPPLPRGEKREKKDVLLPYTGPQTSRIRNGENVELYAVYPFRIFGMGKPDLQIARDTFDVRTFYSAGCWMQDPIHAAYLGLTAKAKKDVEHVFKKQSPYTTFPGFWAPTNDYDPDQDNGGNGENALQKMLMHCDGKKILLLPAWPKEWEADFRLNAPYQTKITGHVKDGKITSLKVDPEARRADVVVGP